MTACHKLYLKWIIICGLIAFVISLAICRVRRTYQTVLEEVDLTHDEFTELIDQSRTLPVRQTDGHANFLLLGTDTLDYRDQDAPLTDTIILGSLNFSSGSVSLISLPRDIYLPDYNRKINAIYTSAYQASAATALATTTDTIGQIFSLPIHYSAVVSLADVRDFIDLVGGVDVVIDQSFTDYQYPRSDVDINVVTDPNLLYETVSFATGEAHLDGETAIKFIRSRHGDNNEGNDYARSRRQQKVLSSLAQSVVQRLVADFKKFDFTFFGQLYAFYQDRFASQIPFVELLALGRDYLLSGQPLTISSQSLAINPGDAAANLRESEPTWRNPQWSLIITNRQGLIEEVQQKLNLL